MTPVMRARLQAASDFVLAELGRKTKAADIIARLVADHRAFFRRGNTSELRVAGVTATCTHDHGAYLLDRWKANATIALMTEAANG